MSGGDRQTHRWRTNLPQVLRYQFLNARRRLIWHQPEREFGTGPRRHNGFAAFTLVTAGESVDFQSGPRATLFNRRAAALAEKFRNPEKLFVSPFVERQTGQLSSLVSRKRNHVVIEMRDSDAALLVSEFCQHLAECHSRIVQRSSVDAGVQIARGAVQFDFQRGDAA